MPVFNIQKFACSDIQQKQNNEKCFKEIGLPV